MSTDLKRKTCWVQCRECGIVYTTTRKIPVEEIFVKTNCPKCGSAMGLNLGDNEDDIYLYMDINMDRRVY
jgi:Zn finger protein HypA/HybF involved in hydrogenase expression